MNRFGGNGDVNNERSNAKRHESKGEYSFIMTMLLQFKLTEKGSQLFIYRQL